MTDAGAGLLGSAAARTFTLSTVGLVTVVALVVAVAATFVPAVRAARTSTVPANAVFVTWATALDNARRSSAQVLPALTGAILGIPGGLALIAAVDPDATTSPPVWQLLAVVPADGRRRGRPRRHTGAKSPPAARWPRSLRSELA